jgi:hypothetical protein
MAVKSAEASQSPTAHGSLTHPRGGVTWYAGLMIQDDDAGCYARLLCSRSTAQEVKRSPLSAVKIFRSTRDQLLVAEFFREYLRIVVAHLMTAEDNPLRSTGL